MINFNASAQYTRESRMFSLSSPRPRLQFNIITDEAGLRKQLVSLMTSLQVQMSSDIRSYDKYDLLLNECLQAGSRQVVFVQMEKTGFFHFLKQVDRRNIHVIAMINGSEEELLAARLLELECMVKQQVSQDNLQLLLDRIIGENELV